jgi:hypothetical protein
MTYFWSVAWVLSGVAAWGACEQHLRDIGKEPSTLKVRDIMRLIMMLLGPLYFLCALAVDRERRRRGP